MKSIQPEIDELMWAIAESGDVDAVHQFETRHPELKLELLRRLKSVDALKKEGKTVQGEIPVFRSAQVRPVDPKPFYLIAGFASLCLIIPATVIFLSNRKPAEPAPQVPIVIYQQAPAEQKPKEPEQSQEPLIQNTNPVENVPQAQPLPKPNDPPVEPDPRTSMKLSNASLHDAVRLIAESGKLSVTIAPGLSNPEVTIDFQDMTPMEMLKEMGKEYGFAVLPDGNRELLILPLEDSDGDKTGNTRQTN